MAILFDKQHVSLRSVKDVAEICQPLFKQINLSYFHYARFYKDGTIFALYSRTDWHDYFWTQKFETRAPLPDNNLVIDRAKVTLWRGGAVQDHVIETARNDFNLDHPLSITIPQKDHFESFSFGTETGNDAIINQYFSQMQSLLHFTHRFRDQASHLIKEGSRTRVAVPQAQVARELKLLDRASEQGQLIDTPSGRVQLSPKETAIARSLCWGMHAKAIAERHQRSVRTIETHIERIKLKLGVRRQSDVVALLVGQLLW